MAFLITHFFEGGTEDQYKVVLDAAHPVGKLAPWVFCRVNDPTTDIGVAFLVGHERHRSERPIR